MRCRRFAFSRKSPSGPGLFEDFFHWYVFKVSSFPRVKGVVLEGGSDVSCSHKKYVFFATTYENALRQKRVTFDDVSMRCLQNRKDDEDDDDSAFVVCVECECVRQWCVCVCVCVVVFGGSKKDSKLASKRTLFRFQSGALFLVRPSCACVYRRRRDACSRKTVTPSRLALVRVFLLNLWR